MLSGELSLTLLKPVATRSSNLAATFDNDFHVAAVLRSVREPHAAIQWLAVLGFVKTEEPADADFFHGLDFATAELHHSGVF